MSLLDSKKVSKKTEKVIVSVIIATFKRDISLKKALE